MTGTCTPAMDIGGRRSERYDSDRTSEDMSFIASPEMRNIGTSFVDVQGETSSDGVRATVHVAAFNFGTMPSVKEENDAVKPACDVELLPGETRIPIKGQTVYVVENGTVFLTNYRLISVSSKRLILVFPLLEIDQCDLGPGLIRLYMKAGRMHAISFPSTHEAEYVHAGITIVLSRLNKRNHYLYADRPPADPTAGPDPTPPIYDVFAWKFSEAVDAMPELPSCLKRPDSVANEITHVDFDRLGMKDLYKITNVNEKFDVCATYPEKVIVPKGITDDEIVKGAVYRSIGRFPAVIWRCRATGAVLLRSSQPQVGILSWRNAMDEKIIEEAVNASRIEGQDKKQFIIMDARPYSSAFANRARSGGYEVSEYYQSAKIEFLGLPNIHSVRSSFANIRSMLHNLGPNENLLQNLQGTGWLNNVSNLLASAASCADYLSKGHPVLVHCSDGWDRTTQVTTLAKIMLDAHYRTLEGFEQLVRRDWIAFGHKLADRQMMLTTTWSTDTERSPIFLQFLEAVRHLQREQPTAFEFSHAYLVKLAKHAHSGLFGSFLFNSHKERKEIMAKRNATLVEIWRFIGKHNEEYVNMSYDSAYTGPLKPMNLSVLNLRVWHEVFADEGERYTLIYNTAPKEERPASGCSTPITTTAPAMLKSKSSESINSVTVEKESGVEVASIAPASLNISMTTSFHQATSSSDEATSLDFDGLPQFQDDEQATLRKKAKQQQEKLQRKQQEIDELKKRCESGDKTAKGRMGSVGDFDSESESGMTRAMSDMSMVDPENELPHFRPNTTWEAEATNCCLCSREFKKMTLYGEERPHHCRNCGRVVCDGCSRQRFSVVEEGVNVQKRVCDLCYDSMHETRVVSAEPSEQEQEQEQEPENESIEVEEECEIAEKEQRKRAKQWNRRILAEIEEECGPTEQPIEEPTPNLHINYQAQPNYAEYEFEDLSKYATSPPDAEIEKKKENEEDKENDELPR
ncbi:unnamed protein product [Caenorhabditis sp. 36 PRJEB53466]|nr:unnamed protein product [Caenorhabditis sp. 36 PRJEB53466]